MRETGNHPCLSEDWLIDNLPPNMTYDCHTGDVWGFIIYPRNEEPIEGFNTLFIPLDLLKLDRTKNC